MKKIVLIGLLAMCGAKIAKAEDIFEVLAYVGRNNPRIQAKRAELLSICTLKSQAQTGYLPRVDLVATVAPEHRDYSSSFLSQDMTDNAFGHSFGANACINLYEGGKTESREKIADHRKSAAEFSLLAVKQNVYLQAIQAYIFYLDTGEVLQLKISNLRVLEEYYKKCRDQVALGRGTQTDVAQAEARLTGAISQVTEAESELKNAEEQFCAVVGKFPGKLSPIQSEKIIKLIPETFDECEKIAMKDHPMILRLKATEKIAEENRNLAKSGMRPSVNGRVFIGRQLKQPMIGKMTRYQAELSLSVPIYDGNLSSYKEQEASHEIIRAMSDTEEARRQIVKAVRISLNEIHRYKSQIQSAQSPVKANERALAGVRDEAANGSRTTLDVLNAEQELLDSRVKLSHARHCLILSYFKALHAIGRLANLCILIQNNKKLDFEGENSRQLQSSKPGVSS
jgi:outer membrane protein